MNTESGRVETLLTGRGHIGRRAFEIKILDTRTNLCENIKLASIIVKEKPAESTNDLEASKIYSLN